MPNIKLNSSEISSWFNAIRNLSDDNRNKYLDAFWSGQLDSKAWLIDQLSRTVREHSLSTDNIYIFGGWIGVLASMLFQSDISVGRIISIDLDPECQSISSTVCERYHERFISVTDNMASYDYRWDITPAIVINTSCEHVDGDTYYRWYDRVYPGTIIVAQSNNYFECEQHVRCSKSLRDFESMNGVVDPLWSGELVHDIYTRYMSIWIK
jgi:hypothetical protein